MSDEEEDDDQEEEEDEEEEEEHTALISRFKAPKHLASRQEIKEKPILAGTTQSEQSKKKQPSRREKRRQYIRRAKKLLASPEIASNDYIKYLDPSEFLSPTFIRALQCVLISVYGLYGLMAFTLMIFYVLDFKLSLFNYTLVADAGTIMTIFFVFTSFLSIMGCYSTYLVGLSKEKTERLTRIYYGLDSDHHECADVGQFMRDDGDAFLVQNDIFIVGQSDVKYELSKTLHRVHKLGVTLAQYEAQYKNIKIKKIIHWIQMVYQHMYLQGIKLRALQDRSRIIRLFYQKQLKDGEAGLTEREFKELTAHLDSESNDAVHEELSFAFPEFEDFDRDENNVVDIIEFEDQLNKVYQEVFNKIEKKYNKNKSPEAKFYEKELIKSERDKNSSLLASLRKYVKPKKKEKNTNILVL